MRMDRKMQILGAVCATGLLAVAGSAPASVDPSSSDVTLSQGQSTTITKKITVPDIPAKVDVGLLIDLSFSYHDDLPNIEAAVGPLHDQISAEADARFGVASFVDYPFIPWGIPPLPQFGFPGDYAYQRDVDMTADKTALQTAVNTLDPRDGGDVPESQYEGLFQVATGAGRDVGAPGPSLGDVAAGQRLSFRADATKVLVITTDAAFHTPNDSQCDSPSPPCPFGYPGPSRNATVAALVAAGIKVIALKAPESGSEMDDIAAATGGAVVTTDSQSSDIGDAILKGLSEVLVDITPDGSSCAPIQVSFNPISHEDIPSGESREFQETVTVPADTPAGTYECTVDFGAAGTQTLRVTVPHKPTALEAEPAIATVVPGLKVPLGRLEARLTSGGAPVAGKTITMTVGTQTICSATTGANGVASCSGTFRGLLSVVLNLGYTATFAGDKQYLGSSDQAPIVRALGVNVLRN